MKRSTNVSTRIADLILDEFGVLHIKMKANIQVDYEDALDLGLATKLLTKGKPRFLLLDFRTCPQIDKKAEVYFKTIYRQHCLARATVRKTTFKAMVLNAITWFSRTKIPTKNFASYDRAMNWLTMQINIAT